MHHLDQILPPALSCPVNDASTISTLHQQSARWIRQTQNTLLTESPSLDIFKLVTFRPTNFRFDKNDQKDQTANTLHCLCWGSHWDDHDIYVHATYENYCNDHDIYVHATYGKL